MTRLWFHPFLEILDGVVDSAAGANELSKHSLVLGSVSVVFRDGLGNSLGILTDQSFELTQVVLTLR